MQLWLARDSGVSLREQLVTQIKLAIAANQLAPGAKLPSTRELARRYRVHANTVSAAYQQLEDERWIDLRHGSGVYVRTREQSSATSTNADALVSGLLATALNAGVSRSQLVAAMQRELARPQSEELVLVEPDPELGAILVAELAAAEIAVNLIGTPKPDARFVLARASQISAVGPTLPDGAHVTSLQVRAISDALTPYLPLPKDVLVAVASRWSGFLESAAAVLSSAGLPQDALLLIDAREHDWKQRATSSAAVICDVVSAKALLSSSSRIIAFPLLSSECLSEVERLSRWLRS